MATDKGQFAQENEESFYLMFIIVVPILFGLMWYFFGRYVYAWERIALYGALSLWGTFPTDWLVLGWFTRKFLYFRHTHPSEIEFFADAVPDSLIVNGMLIVVIIALVLKRVIYIGRHHPFSTFGRTMNLYDYVFQQMPLYPHLRVMWKLRLLARPLDDGLFRMGDSAKRFAIRNKLVKLPQLDGEPVLDEKLARRLFESQLKTMLPMPTDDPQADARACIAKLSNDEKAVLAAVVCRLAVCDANVSDKEFDAALAKSNALVTQYWESYDSYNPQLPTDEHHKKNPDMPLVPPPPPVNTAGCDEVLMKYLVYPKVRESMLGHAYVRTFLYDALQACRKVGKFTPARFRWMRMTDRSLWLVLSSAGRSAPFWEAAGLHAHYLAERKAKRPSEKPQTAEAVAALQFEFTELVAFSRVQREEIWEQQGGVGVEVKKAPPKETRKAPPRVISAKS